MRSLLAALLICTLAFAGPAEAAKKKPKPPTAKQCTTKAIKKLKGKKKRDRVKACKKRAAAKKKKPPVAAKPPAAPPVVTPPRVEGGIDDAVVIAVIDGGFNPYHFDNLASKMPQHQNATKGDDLPLDKPLTDWLPGFDAAKAGFKSFERLDLTLSGDPAASAADLRAADAAQWEKVKTTADATGVNAVWFPGTKVIGAVDFGDNSLWEGGASDHGVGTTSSSVGNLHGTCPECLLVFVDYGNAVQGEKAIDWVMNQPWIDAISNSYGFSLATRDRIYSKSNTELQRTATERGQEIFFSAGNGVDGAYVVPNSTAFSSQEGPDWIVTVGAITPGEDNYYGPPAETPHANYMSGKPADIAGIGSDYPTAYGATEIGATGKSGFGGTSNATPQTAGYYGRALYMARKALPGPSRAQENGVIARGGKFACGAARPDCELGDGVLTRSELQTRLFHGALPTGNGTYEQAAGTPGSYEEDLLGQGHGAYFGRESADREAWLAEFARITGPMEGTAPALARPQGELEWMIVDSYCRQENWGDWTQGYFLRDQTELPGSDPAWPVRSSREETCLGGPTPIN
jgi:hypothetical protein